MHYKVFGQRTGLRVSTMILGTGMLGKAGGYSTEAEDARVMLHRPS